VLFALALVAVPARAQLTDADRARADTLFREGQDLLTAGQIATACAKLEESQRLDPKIGRLLNLAYCHEKQGRTATAWNEYNQAAALAVQTKQAERESFARKQATTLAQRLSFLQIDLKAAAEVTQVAVDGSSLTRDQWTVPFPVDPGEHTLAFGAAGRKTRTETVTVAAPGTMRIAVDPLEPEAPSSAGAPPSPSPTPSQSPPAMAANALPEQVEAPASHPSRLPGWIVGGVGVAALGVGAAFGLRAMQLKSDADPQCPNRQCTPQGASNISDAKTAALISTIGLAAGAVGVGVGAWLILRVPSSSAATSSQVAPYVAADRAGLAWQGVW
jgi:hypothetical protein